MRSYMRFWKVLQGKGGKTMKKLLALLLVFILVFSLVACGSETDEPETNDDANVEDTEDDTEDDAEEPVSFEGQTLRILSKRWEKVEERQFIVEEILSKFEEEYGVTVELEIASDADIDKILETSFGADNLNHDLLIGFNGNMPRYVENEWVLPLDELKSEIDYTFLEAFDSTSIVDGKQYFLMFDSDVYLLIAHNDALQYLPDGVTKESVEAGELTWEQYKEWALNIKTGEGKGKTTMPALPGKFFLYEVGGMQLSYGSSYPEIYSDGSKAAWELINEMIDGGALIETNDNYWTISETMKTDEAWLSVFHMAHVGEVYNAAPADYVVAPAPTGPNGKGSIAGGHGFGILNGAENEALAKEFIKWFMQDEILYTVSTGYSTVIPPIEEMIDTLGNDPEDTIIRMGIATLKEGVVSYLPISDFTDWGLVKEVYDTTYTELKKDGMVSDEFLMEKQAELDALRK